MQVCLKLKRVNCVVFVHYIIKGTKQSPSKSFSDNISNPKFVVPKRKRQQRISRTEIFSDRKDALIARVNLVEYQLGKVMFSHTGMAFSEAFAHFDKDGNGLLDKEEIRYILNQTDVPYTQEELDMLMDRFHKDGITVEEFKRTCRVQRDTLLKYVKEKERYRQAFAELPVVVLFFMVFVLLLYGHGMTSTKYAASTGVLAGVLHPANGGTKFTAVTSVNKVWRWLENEFLDYAFVQKDSSDNPLPRKDWGYISQYCKYLSEGVYLSQVRAMSDDCVLKKVNAAYGDKCFPPQKPSSLPFGPPTCGGAKVEGKCVDSNFTGFTAKNKVFTTILDYRRPRHELERTITQLKKYQWIDKGTAWLDIKYYLLNLHLGTYTRVHLEFVFHRGGRVVPTYKADSLIVDPYAGASIGWAVLDALWIAFQIYTAVSECRDLCEDGLKDYTKGCSGAWNMLDWTQIVVTLVVAGLWFTMVGYLARTRDMDDSNTAEMERFVDTIEIIDRYKYYYALLSIANLFILVIRFFKGFAAQPRLRVVVDTIVDAAVDLAHWLVIFVSILTTLVMMALFLFGHRVLAFSDATSAFVYLFRGWIGPNSLPVKQFADTEPEFAIAWYLFYIPSLIFVLNRLVTAIILGAFRAANNESKDSLTLWAQTRDVCADMNAKYKNLMKLTDVIDVLENPENTLAQDLNVTFNSILSSYRQKQDLTDAQDEYAAKFVLSLMEEFFVYYDKVRDEDRAVRRRNAFNRTKELDDDFADVHERLDLVERHLDNVLSTLHAKFEFDDH